MPTMKAVQAADSGVFEVVEAGAAVTGLRPGDRVVVNPQAAPSGITGCGGAHGGMAEYLLIVDEPEMSPVDVWSMAAWLADSGTVAATPPAALRRTARIRSGEAGPSALSVHALELADGQGDGGGRARSW